MSDCSTHQDEYPGVSRLIIRFTDKDEHDFEWPFVANGRVIDSVQVDGETYIPSSKAMKLVRTNGELLRCLENDWNISASWDGLRKFWCIELTEEGVRLRDAELNSRAERTCKMETDHDELEVIAYSHEDTWAYKCSVCGWSFRYDRGIKPNYCPNCGCKVVCE